MGDSTPPCSCFCVGASWCDRQHMSEVITKTYTSQNETHRTSMQFFDLFPPIFHIRVNCFSRLDM